MGPYATAHIRTREGRELPGLAVGAVVSVTEPTPDGTVAAEVFAYNRAYAVGTGRTRLRVLGLASGGFESLREAREAIESSVAAGTIRSGRVAVVLATSTTEAQVTSVFAIGRARA